MSGSIMFELYCSAVSIPRQHQVEDAMEQNMPPIRKQRSQLTPTACVRCRVKKVQTPRLHPYRWWRHWRLIRGY